MTDSERLQGTCVQTAWERDGERNPPDPLGGPARVTFAGDTFAVVLADGTTPIAGTFKLDPSRDPKAADWTDTLGPDAGKTFPAVYQLDGDELSFCAADAGQPRPTSLTPGPGQVLRVHRRATP
jgi:uncharacterized protein (TIGR03067 family)